MKDRTRILFLVSTLRRSGPTVQLLNIVRSLELAEFDPAILTLSAEPEGSMLRSFRDIGIKVESLSLSRTRSMIDRRWTDRIRHSAGFDPDDRCVIHSQGIRADMIAARALGGFVRVATVHNYPGDDYPMKYGPVLGRWMARRHLQAFRALPTLVACSSTLAGRLRNHRLTAAVIRNGVDTARFVAAPVAMRADVRRHLGLDERARVAVCAGSLIARKNCLSVIRAVRNVDAPNLVVILVGGGVLEAELRRAAHGDPRIRFTGHVNDVAPYLQAADFFVSASRSEGMPSAVLEAIACGLPLVLSDIEPHRELLDLIPSAGTLVALQDDGALAAALQRAASMPETGPKHALAIQAAEVFGAEQLSRRYQELYRRLVALPRDEQAAY